VYQLQTALFPVLAHAVAEASDLCYVIAQMYRYGGDGSEEDLVRFMIDEYREVHGEDVPPPPSMLSDLREKLLDFMDEHWTPVCVQLTHGILTDISSGRC